MDPYSRRRKAFIYGARTEPRMDSPAMALWCGGLVFAGRRVKSGIRTGSDEKLEGSVSHQRRTCGY